MKICPLFLFVVYILFSPYIYGQESASDKWTLKKCIDVALQNNIALRQEELQVNTEELNNRQSKENLLPFINGNYNHGINQGRSIDPFTNSYIDQHVNYDNYYISSGIVLFNGFFLQNSLRKNVLSFQASKMELQQIQEQLMLNVIASYLQVLTNEDLLDQSRQQVELSKKQSDRLGELNTRGAITPSEFYDLKGQLASDRALVVANKNALENAKLFLIQLMNIPSRDSFNVAPALPLSLPSTNEISADSIFAGSLTTLSAIKATELRTKSASKGIHVARGEYFPKISLYGNINTNYSSLASRDVLTGASDNISEDYVSINGNTFPVFKHESNTHPEKIKYNDQFKNNYNTSVVLTMTIPILNSFQSRNRIAQAKIDLKKAELEEEKSKIQLRQNIEQAISNMKNALDRLSELQEQVSNFSESFRESEIRFNAGAINQIDYLVAKNNMDKSKSNLIIAKYDVILRTYILNYYIKGTVVTDNFN